MCAGVWAIRPSERSGSLRSGNPGHGRRSQCSELRFKALIYRACPDRGRAERTHGLSPRDIAKGMWMEGTYKTTSQVLRRVAVHTAIIGLICLCLKGLVLVDTESLFGQTLLWTLVWIIGRVVLYWMHLINETQNLERLMKIFEMNRGTYMTRTFKYLEYMSNDGSINVLKIDREAFGAAPLRTFNLVFSAATHVSHFLGFILITASFSVLPELIIFCIVLAATIVTIRQTRPKKNEHPISWWFYFKYRFLDFFSYAGGMFAAAMILYSITVAASH